MTNCPYPIVDLKDYVFFQEGPGLRKWQWTEDGMKVINVTNILSDGSFDISNTSRFISLDEFRQKYSHFAVEADDVVVASSGNTYGKVGRVRACHLPIMMNTSVIRFHPINPNKLQPDYLYAFLRSDFFRGQIERFVVGSAQPNFGPTHVKLMQLILPDWEHQCRIASIVSAYDDLIENNTRRIEILEEIARRLYEEWFVQFRFPGHEGGVFENDMLPQGWVYSQLSEIASYISRGISPKYDEEASCRVINQKCIRNQRLDVQLSRRQNKKVPAEKLIQLGDVLINSTGVGTLGRVAQVHEVLEDVTVDSHVTIARAGDSVDVDYFGSTLLSLQHFFELQGVGSTGQTELSRSRIAETKVIVPPYELQVQFGKLIRPMRVLGTWLAKKNSNLRAQRDLLLPKLISGEIDVSDIPMPT